mmetsp:Transcript_40162/g.72108  ORF Transcript_40162/g.72108 Transcript_40162/m.72108 type:complete len:266 (-) Transcript_40162:139-936(-)
MRSEDHRLPVRCGLPLAAGRRVLCLFPLVAVLTPHPQPLALQLVAQQRVKFEGGAQPRAHLPHVLHLQHSPVRGVELHHLDCRVKDAVAVHSHLLTLQSRQPHFPVVAGHRAAATLHLLLLLQVLQGAREAQCSAVKVTPPHLKRKQKGRGCDQLPAPRGQTAPTDREHVLQLLPQFWRQVTADQGIAGDVARSHTRAQHLPSGWLHLRKQPQPVAVERVKEAKHAQHVHASRAGVDARQRRHLKHLHQRAVHCCTGSLASSICT